jgi:ribosomal-protein-alanine N-acetyltransferase
MEDSLDIKFQRLNEVSKSEIIELMNHPLVRRHMPLTRDNFSDIECDEFIANKESIWAEHGYGPWAFIMDGQFVGWGGLQPENGEVGLGLVLHPRYWGIGRALYDYIMERAFGDMGFESVTILFPPTRTRIKGVLRLGFEPDGEVRIGGERFLRYRLHAPRRQ